MYNRKFDTHRDFHELNELENRIMPIVRKIHDEDEKEVLTAYLREIFNNQWKK